MSREQELKAAFIGAISRYNTGKENLAPFCNELKDLVSKYLQCPADAVVVLDKDGTGPGEPAFEGCHWSFVLGIRFAGIEMQVPLSVWPGADAETFYIARVRGELAGFQVPQKRHALIEHIFKTMKGHLDRAILDQKPDKPIRIGF